MLLLEMYEVPDQDLDIGLCLGLPSRLHRVWSGVTKA